VESDDGAPKEHTALRPGQGEAALARLVLDLINLLARTELTSELAAELADELKPQAEDILRRFRGRFPR